MKESFKQASQLKLAVIGLGYVGLPLAVAFANSRSVIAFDINPTRIEQLKKGKDVTGEISSEELELANGLFLTCDAEDLGGCDCFIITVPTPIDEKKQPDLGPLLSASEIVGSFLSVGDIVVYESTVYPGCTEEQCVPVLERISSLSYNEEFFCGYSPERINPGDRTHRLSDIVKVTSGSTPIVADLIDELYGFIISAGTYKAENILVAEAAKVIENTQRDLNIALINELAVIFHKMEIDIYSVLRAAKTKWNFLPFEPGLVGGHCIGVDPYYLTFKAQQLGMNPELILAGRRTNDGMAHHVADRIMNLIQNRFRSPRIPDVLVLGVSFKENCPDLRNSQTITLIRQLELLGCNVSACDPLVNQEQAKMMLGEIFITELSETATYHSIVLAVPHAEFIDGGKNCYQKHLKRDGFIFDLKARLGLEENVVSL